MIFKSVLNLETTVERTESNRESLFHLDNFLYIASNSPPQDT